MKPVQPLLALAALALTELALAAALAQPSSRPVQITSGGCCVDPAWSPDSRRVLYIDKPTPSAPTGIYGVSAAPGSGGPLRPTLAFSRVAFYSPDFKFAVLPGTGSDSTVERLSDRQRFTVPTAGSGVVWGPGNARLAWSVAEQTGNYDRRAARVYVSSLGGSPSLVTTIYGGGVAGWLDANTFLLVGKDAPLGAQRVLRTLDLRTRSGRVLASAQNLRGVSPSPDGRRVVYLVAFDKPGTNGLFLVNTSSGSPLKLPFFGSYRWRNTTRLVYVPLEPGAASHRLLEYDAASGQSRTLLDLGAKIAGDNWELSPDGAKVVFQSVKDRNLYVVALP